MNKLLLLAFLAALACSSCAFAGGGSGSSQALPENGPWRQVSFLTDKQKAAGRSAGGEGGQQITSMSWSASDPSRVAFCVDVAGTWLSDDGGKTWKMRKGEMLANKMQGGLAIDPKNADVVYVWAIGEGPSASGNKWKGLYRTLDGGLSWKQIASPARFPVGAWAQPRFAFLPDEAADKALGRSSCVFTCQRDRILVSRDGGDSFSFFGPELPGASDPKFKATGLAIVRAEPLMLLVGTSNGVFQVSEDGVVKAGQRIPENAAVTGMAQHPKSPNVVWAVADKRLFKSIDCGETFDEIGIGVNFSAVFVSPADGNVLYNPVGYTAIYYSHDGGYSWSASSMDESLSCRHSGGWAQGFAPHPEKPLEALACFGDRIFRTHDGGASWSDSSTGWTGTRSTTRDSFFFHPTDKRVTGIGSLDWGFFYTVNGGSSWRYCWAQGVPRARSVCSLLLDPRADWQSGTGPQRILAYSGMWDKQILIRSEDGGSWKAPAEGKQTWTTYDALFRKGRLAAYNMKRPGMVYMGQQKSLDWGLSWKEIPQPADAMSRSNNDILYSMRKYSDGYGLIRSTDCGETWQELKGRLKQSVNDIDVAPDDPNCVYAATGHGLAIWKDGVWKECREESGLAPDGFGAFSFSSIAADAKNPGRVYAGAWADYFGNSSGVWASDDHGATWRNVSANLGPMSIWAIAVDPRSGSVYVGTSYGHWVLDRP